MFQVDSDLTIYLTRGDMIAFAVKAKADGEPYVFQPGDVVRFNVCEKKNVENVIFIKDFPATEECEEVEIMLTCEETKFGAKISKPVDYWYWVVLNPLQPTAQSIIGYDEDGAKILKLFPEGDDVEETDPIEPEDIPIVDNELDLTSTRPVQNQAVARAITRISYLAETTQKALAVEKAKLDNMIEHKYSTVAQPLEYMGYISEETKAKIDGAINSDGVHATITVRLHEANQFYGGSGMDVFIIPAECRPIDVGTVHTASGLEYIIRYDNESGRYLLYIGATNDVMTAPEEAGVATFSYALADFELIDARVGFDGVRYGTVGEAIRAQFAQIMDAINEINTDRG